jgi:hypothetical protein
MKTRTYTRALVATITSVGLTLVAAESRAQFMQSDLEGTWSSFVPRDNPVANDGDFKHGTVTIDAVGNVPAEVTRTVAARPCPTPGGRSR